VLWEIASDLQPEPSEWRVVLGTGEVGSPQIDVYDVVGWVTCVRMQGGGTLDDRGIFPAIMEPDFRDPLRVRVLHPDFMDVRNFVAIQMLPPGKEPHRQSSLERLYRDRRTQRGR
jgi:hypothetical protein